jgi:hypothetical protein
MTLDEALAMRCARALGKIPADFANDESSGETPE